MNDSYIYVITALLPLSACMLVFQVNPYHALVIRGILGAVAALVYAMFGAADVALTEALVGTMLAITLYAVAVRSSLTMRLGVLKDGPIEADDESLPDGKDARVEIPEEYENFGQLIDDLRAVLRKHYMRLELVPYKNLQALQRALIDKEIHASCTQQWRSPFRQQQRLLAIGDRAQRLQQDNQESFVHELQTQPYHTSIRVQRLYEIMQAELSSPTTSLSYVNKPDIGEKH